MSCEGVMEGDSFINVRLDSTGIQRGLHDEQL